MHTQNVRACLLKVLFLCSHCGVPVGVRMLEPSSESEVEEEVEVVGWRGCTVNPANPAVLNLCLSAPEEEQEQEQDGGANSLADLSPPHAHPPAASAPYTSFLFSSFLT